MVSPPDSPFVLSLWCPGAVTGCRGNEGLFFEHSGCFSQVVVSFGCFCCSGCVFLTIFRLAENRSRSIFLNRSIEPGEFCKSQGNAYRGACKHCAPTCTETVVFCFSLIVFSLDLVDFSSAGYFPSSGFLCILWLCFEHSGCFSQW